MFKMKTKGKRRERHGDVGALSKELSRAPGPLRLSLFPHPGGGDHPFARSAGGAYCAAGVTTGPSRRERCL